MATSPQTSVVALDRGVPGQLVGARHRIEPATSEEATAGIAFGLALKAGTAARFAKLPSAIEGETLVGVACFCHAYDRDREVDSDGLQPAATFGLLRRGQVQVTSEDAVTPASGVHVRMVAGLAGPAGGFRGTIGTETVVIADLVFTAANATETFTSAAHGLLTGDGPVRVSNAGGALPTGLLAATDYWVIRLTANTFRLATSRANALLGTNLLISTDGTGTQTLADVAGTERVQTVDVSAFCSWRSSAAGGEVAQLEVDFTKSALATRG